MILLISLHHSETVSLFDLWFKRSSPKKKKKRKNYHCSVKTLILKCFLKFFPYEDSFWIESLRFMCLVSRAIQIHLHNFHLAWHAGLLSSYFPMSEQQSVNFWMVPKISHCTMSDEIICVRSDKLSILDHEQNIVKTQWVWTNHWRGILDFHAKILVAMEL